MGAQSLKGGPERVVRSKNKIWPVNNSNKLTCEALHSVNTLSAENLYHRGAQANSAILRDYVDNEPHLTPSQNGYKRYGYVPRK